MTHCVNCGNEIRRDGNEWYHHLMSTGCNNPQASAPHLPAARDVWELRERIEGKRDEWLRILNEHDRADPRGGRGIDRLAKSARVSAANEILTLLPAPPSDAQPPDTPGCETCGLAHPHWQECAEAIVSATAQPVAGDDAPLPTEIPKDLKAIQRWDFTHLMKVEDMDESQLRVEVVRLRTQEFAAVPVGEAPTDCLECERALLQIRVALGLDLHSHDNLVEVAKSLRARAQADLLERSSPR